MWGPDERQGSALTTSVLHEARNEARCRSDKPWAITISNAWGKGLARRRNDEVGSRQCLVVVRGSVIGVFKGCLFASVPRAGCVEETGVERVVYA